MASGVIGPDDWWIEVVELRFAGELISVTLVDILVYCIELFANRMSNTEFYARKQSVGDRINSGHAVNSIVDAIII